MASPTLAVLHSPDFSQILRAAIDRAVSRLIERIDESHLGCCSYESPESRSGACDGVPCIQKATVHHLENEQDYCLAHFRVVSRA